MEPTEPPGRPAGDPIVVRGRRAVREALCRSDLGSRPPTSEVGRGNLLLLDGDEHTAIRQVLDDHLRAIDRPALARFVERCSARLLDGIEFDRADLVADYLEPLTAGFAAKVVLGVEPDPELTKLTQATRGTLEPDGATGAMFDLAMAIQRLHRAAGIPLVTTLAPISRQAALVTPAVAIHGAYENPLNLLALAAEHLATSPLPLTDAELLGTVLASRPPVHRTLRWTRSSGGAAKPVWIDLASACSEQAAEGRPWASAAFGFGPHRCPGVALTETLAGVVLRDLRQAIGSRTWTATSTLVRSDIAHTVPTLHLHPSP